MRACVCVCVWGGGGGVVCVCNQFLKFGIFPYPKWGSHFRERHGERERQSETETETDRGEKKDSSNKVMLYPF